MSVRWKDKTNITVDGVDRMPITDASDDNTDKYITAEQLALYTLNGTTRAEVSLLDAGSNEAIYDSGTSVNIRASGQDQVKITATTIEPVLNIGIDLGSTSKKFKNLHIDNVNADNDVIVERDVNVGRLLYFSGFETNDKATLPTASSTESVHRLDGSEAFTLTLADGYKNGQVKFLYIINDSFDVTVSANIGGTSLTFSSYGQGAWIIWDSVESNWIVISTTATWVA